MPTPRERRLKRIPVIGTLAKRAQLDRIAHKGLWTKSDKYPREKVALPQINTIENWSKHRMQTEAAAKRRFAAVKEALKARAKRIRANSKRK